MAVYTNELKLDVAPFMASVKKAIGVSGQLPDDRTIKIDADAAGAIADTKKVGDAVEAIPDTKAIKVEVEGADKASGILSKFTGATQGVGSALGGGLGGILGSLPPQFAAVGVAVGVVGAAFADTYAKGKAFNEGLKQAQIQTGLTGAEFKKLEESAKTAFINGVGESAAEALKIVSTLKQTFGDALPTDQLDKAAIKANAVGKALGIEANELAAKASPLIKQYGLDFNDAMDLVTAGAQNGVQDIGGYLDAISEFSPNAKEAGLSAQEFTGLLQRAGKEGLKDFAKVGDGIKELQNRIKSGDLTAQVSQYSGEIGNQLQDIAKLGQSGALSGKEVLAQSITAIDEQFKSGKITEAMRGQMLTVFGGSIAEDIGSDAYTRIFSSPIDEAAIKAAAAKAGQVIDESIPPPSLGAIFETVQTEIGQVFDNIYKNVIAPILTPIIDGFTAIRTAFSEAFSGGGGEGMQKVLGVIVNILKGGVMLAVERVVSYFKILFKIGQGVFDGIKAAVSPVIDAFSDLFGGVGEGVDVFQIIKNVMSTVADVIGKVFYVAIRLVLTPMRIMGEIAGFLIKKFGEFLGWVEGLRKSFVDFLLSITPVRDAIQAVIDAVVGAGKAIGDFAGKVGGAISGFLGLGDSAEEAAPQVEKAADAAADAGKEIKTAAGDVNSMAASFNASVAAAQAAVANYTAAGAATGKYRSEIAQAAATLRKFEAAQDAAALAGDPNRRRAITASERAAKEATLRLAEELTAQLIPETAKREQALLDIQRKYDKLALDQQIKDQRALIATGGAGVPEARAALVALLEQRNQLTATSDRAQLDLTRTRANERLDILRAASDREIAALTAVSNNILALGDRQLQAGNTSTALFEQTIKARTDAIKASAEASVRGMIESLPEFTKGLSEIQAQVGIEFDEAEGVKRIEELRTTLLNNLLAVPGDERSAFAQQIADTFDLATVEGQRAAIELQSAFASKAIELVSSQVLKDTKSQVLALEQQRDLLLTNAALSEQQRQAIRDSYGYEIDKANKGPIKTTREIVEQIRKDATATVFDFGDGSEQAEDIAKQVAEIQKAFDAGKLSYQEALDAMTALGDATSSFAGHMETVGRAIADSIRGSFAALADESRIALEATTSDLEANLAKQEKLKLDGKEVDEKLVNEQLELEEKAGQQRDESVKALTASGIASFGSLIAAGENVGSALKESAGALVSSLLDLYSVSIIGLFQSIIPPPFGFIAGTAAVIALKGLVSSALASFAEGGPTGPGGKYQVAGVVHKGEWVANQENYKKWGPLFDGIHEGRIGDYSDLYEMLRVNGIAPATMDATPQGIFNIQPVTYIPSQNNNTTAVHGELVAIREQLEGMQAVQKQVKAFEFVHDKDTTIKEITRDKIRRMR